MTDVVHTDDLGNLVRSMVSGTMNIGKFSDNGKRIIQKGNDWMSWSSMTALTSTNVSMMSKQQNGV